MAKKLTQLGHAVSQPTSPDKAKLESVPNPHPDADYVVRFTAPEFTTLCPITGQPDFAHFVIDYVPGKAMVESKSLKLYLPASAMWPDSTKIQPSPSPSGSPPRSSRNSAHRGLLVSARRHSDRCVLADGKIAVCHVAAGDRRFALSRTRLKNGIKTSARLRLQRMIGDPDIFSPKRDRLRPLFRRGLKRKIADRSCSRIAGICGLSMSRLPLSQSCNCGSPVARLAPRSRMAPMPARCAQSDLAERQYSSGCCRQ